jgi:gamma-glutamyltranspeptidase/glutathione hydrolase
MGGDGQAQTHVQVMTNLIDFGMNVQEAIEAPRWLSGRWTLGDPEDVLSLEARFPEDVATDLESRGHPVRRVEAYADIMGHAQGIEIDRASGVLSGGSDPRGDGAAIGW